MNAPDNACEDGQGHRKGYNAQNLIPVIYDELRQLAQWMLAGERPDLSLSATALVHDAYVRLNDGTRVQCVDESHFKALAANCIRRILVDHARARNSAKRGGDRKRLTLDSRLHDGGPAQLDVIELEDLLEVLASDSPRVAAIVELRLYGGLTIKEAAGWLNCSRATVERDWRFARAWLGSQLFDSHEFGKDT